MAGSSLFQTVIALSILVWPGLLTNPNRILFCYEEVCHLHSDICSQIKRICRACEDNTYGPHCNLCIAGYYGNATESKYGCKKCPCPLAKSNGLCLHDKQTNSIKCDKCKEGYHGERCTYCNDGYYKNVTDGLCRRCFCNGHGNASLVQQCDPVGGQCYYCARNRAGSQCESCREGYFLKTVNGTEQCVKCHCNGNSHPTMRPICDLRHGICLQCTHNTTGVNCEKCANGFEGDAIIAKNCTKIQHPDFGTKTATSKYLLVTLVTVLSVIILLLITVTGLVWLRRKKARDPLGFVTINMNHADEDDAIAWIDPVTGDPIHHHAVDTEMPIANGNLEFNVEDEEDVADYDYDNDLGETHEPESRDTDRML